MGSEEMSASHKVTAWLAEFDAALQEGVDQAMKLFSEQECFWRDLLAFTWNIDTFESRDEIVPMLKGNLARVKPTGWEIDGLVYEKPGGLIGSGFTFETSFAWGRGFLWLKGGKCWTIMTAMWDLKGHEETIARSRSFGATVGQVTGRKTWLHAKQQEQQDLGRSKQPYCLIVGGGHAGIMLGARLKVLGVPTIIVEKNPRVGDTWRNRYKTLSLHTPFFSDSYPYMSFPTNWPVLATKDQVGDWMECYTKLMELNYWCSTECKSASFDEKEGRWEVVLEQKSGSEVSEITLRPSQLVFACGMVGYPRIPSFPGAENFEGVQIHSTQYKEGKDWAGKKCVIFGACTSAHDICLDLWEQGASEITMVQKSVTMVVTISDFLESRMEPDLKGGEYDSTFNTDAFDLKTASLPYKVLPRVQIPVYAKISQKEAELHERLNKAGFKTWAGEDGAGIPLMLLRRAGGYYIDVGASELIANGEVKVKNGVAVEAIRANSVVFDDGSEVEAELIIYATGLGNLSDYIERIVSKEAAEKVGLCWGIGSNTKNDPGPWVGELRNMWKPLPVPNLWVTSGGFSHCRFHGRHLALQLKARMEGIPTPVWTLPKE